jgi:hypothetical protein
VRLADPLLLILALGFLPAVLARRTRHLGYSSLRRFDGASGPPLWVQVSRGALVLGIALLLVSLARPQGGSTIREERRESRDIVLVVDQSGSMAEPLAGARAGRIELARDALLRFLDHREGDRVALLAFDDQAYGLWPMTHDLGVVRSKLGTLQGGRGGTNLVHPLEAALAHFGELGQSRSRVLILVTDGEAPIPEALREALVGRLKTDRVHAYLLGIQLDESADVAVLIRQSGGRVWHVRDGEPLDRAFAEINALETSPVVTARPAGARELYPWFALAALGAFSLAITGEALAPRIP